MIAFGETIDLGLQLEGLFLQGNRRLFDLGEFGPGRFRSTR